MSKKGWIIIISSIFVLLFVFSFWGGFKVGYDKGNTKGYSEGHEEGNVSGYSEGYEEGILSGYSKGYDEGNTKGYSEGYDEGNTKGYSEGYYEENKQGYDKGYDEGYEYGNESGYDEGEKRGIEYGFIQGISPFSRWEADSFEEGKRYIVEMRAVDVLEIVQILEIDIEDKNNIWAFAFEDLPETIWTPTTRIEMIPDDEYYVDETGSVWHIGQ